jgi:hypothetical protein
MAGIQFTPVATYLAGNTTPKGLTNFQNQYASISSQQQQQAINLQGEYNSLNQLSAGNVSNGYWTGSPASLAKYNSAVNQYNQDLSTYNQTQSASQNLLSTGIQQGYLIQQPGGSYIINPNLSTPYGQYSLWSQGATAQLQSGNLNIFGLNIGVPKQPTAQQFAAYEQTPAYQNQNLLENIVYGAGKSFVENPGSLPTSLAAGYLTAGVLEQIPLQLAGLNEGAGAGSAIARTALNVVQNPVFQYGVVPAAIGLDTYVQASRGFTASPQQTEINIGSMVPASLGFVAGGLGYSVRTPITETIRTLPGTVEYTYYKAGGQPLDVAFSDLIVSAKNLFYNTADTLRAGISPTKPGETFTYEFDSTGNLVATRTPYASSSVNAEEPIGTSFPGTSLNLVKNIFGTTTLYRGEGLGAAETGLVSETGETGRLFTTNLDTAKAYAQNYEIDNPGLKAVISSVEVPTIDAIAAARTPNPFYVGRLFGDKLEFLLSGDIASQRTIVGQGAAEPVQELPAAGSISYDISGLYPVTIFDSKGNMIRSLGVNEEAVPKVSEFYPIVSIPYEETVLGSAYDITRVNAAYNPSTNMAGIQTYRDIITANQYGGTEARSSTQSLNVDLNQIALQTGRDLAFGSETTTLGQVDVFGTKTIKRVYPGGRTYTNVIGRKASLELPGFDINNFISGRGLAAGQGIVAQKQISAAEQLLNTGFQIKPASSNLNPVDLAASITSAEAGFGSTTVGSMIPQASTSEVVSGTKVISRAPAGLTLENIFGSEAIQTADIDTKLGVNLPGGAKSQMVELFPASQPGVLYPVNQQVSSLFNALPDYGVLGTEVISTFEGIPLTPVTGSTNIYGGINEELSNLLFGQETTAFRITAERLRERSGTERAAMGAGERVTGGITPLTKTFGRYTSSSNKPAESGKGNQVGITKGAEPGTANAEASRIGGILNNLLEKASAQTEETTSGTSGGYLSRYAGGRISLVEEEEVLSTLQTKTPPGMTRPSAASEESLATGDLSESAQDFIVSLGVGQFGGQKVNVGQDLSLGSQNDISSFLDSIAGLGLKSNTLNILGRDQFSRQSQYYLNGVLLGQENVNIQKQDQFQEQQQDQQQWFKQILPQLLQQEEIGGRNPPPPPDEYTGVPPPPWVVLPGGTPTGTGPLGGSDRLEKLLFTEKLNIVTQRQALIGDRMNAMSGLGRNVAVKQNKKNRLF